MENHHFSWEDPRFQWPFSIAMLVYQRQRVVIVPKNLPSMDGSRGKSSQETMLQMFPWQPIHGSHANQVPDEPIMISGWFLDAMYIYIYIYTYMYIYIYTHMMYIYIYNMYFVISSTIKEIPDMVACPMQMPANNTIEHQCCCLRGKLHQLCSNNSYPSPRQTARQFAVSNCQIHMANPRISRMELTCVTFIFIILSPILPPFLRR